MVEISGLVKSYKGFQVLKGLNMSIENGDVYGFLGRNGCGKTTTMNILCNIIPKDGGTVRLGKGEATKIGYLPETPSLFGYMNGYEYLDYIAACANYKDDIKKRTAEVLDIVGMTQGGTRRIKGYSRGMNQRLGIAAAIYDHPDLLILDEPTSALDPEGRAEVMTIINRLKALGTTILLCTHILTDVERVANKIGIINDGVIRESGNINDVISRYSVNSAIKLEISDPNPEKIALIKSADFIKDVKIDGQNCGLELIVDNAEEASCRLMSLLGTNGISAVKLQIEYPSLEQIYLKVVNGNAN